jgi:hypothetical protein
MRKIQATKEQSGLRRLSQASFHLLASESRNICDLILPGRADAFSCAEEHCTEATLNIKSTRVCSFCNILAFIFAFPRNDQRDCFPPPGFTPVYSEVAENSDQDNEGDRHP